MVVDGQLLIVAPPFTHWQPTYLHTTTPHPVGCPSPSHPHESVLASSSGVGLDVATQGR